MVGPPSAVSSVSVGGPPGGSRETNNGAKKGGPPGLKRVEGAPLQYISLCSLLGAPEHKTREGCWGPPTAAQQYAPFRV